MVAVKSKCCVNVAQACSACAAGAVTNHASPRYSRPPSATVSNAGDQNASPHASSRNEYWSPLFAWLASSHGRAPRSCFLNPASLRAPLSAGDHSVQQTHNGAARYVSHLKRRCGAPQPCRPGCQAPGFTYVHWKSRLAAGRRHVQPLVCTATAFHMRVVLRLDRGAHVLATAVQHAAPVMTGGRRGHAQLALNARPC